MSAGKRWEPGVCKRGTLGLAATLVAAAAGFAQPDAAAGLAPTNAAAPQETTFGVLISPNVVCRVAPSGSATVAGVYRQTGDGWRERVLVGDTAFDAEGERWVAVERIWLGFGRCWVPDALVVPYNEADLFLAMADRLLAMPDAVALADWVTAYNYFGLRRYGEPADDSAVRQLRRLEVLMRALQVAQAGLTGQPDPLALAWLESLGDEVEYSADRRGVTRWVVSRKALDALYDEHRADPAAPEILWKSVRYPYDPDECFRSLQCQYGLPLDGVSRYWLAFPDGVFVGEAVWTAIGQIDGLGGSRIGLGGVLETCEQARDAEAGSWPVEAWDRLAWDREGALGARQLLATLNEVGDEERAPLVDYLNELERCAIEVGAGRPIEDPRQSAGAPEPSDQDAAEPGSNGETSELAIIASGVSCRVEPSRTARGYTVFPLDTHFMTERPDTVAGGEAWVSIPNWWGCWVPLSETAPAGKDEHVLAIADRFLTSGEGRTLDHSIRVYNVLASRHQGYRDVVDRSALLALRRLQVLGEVLKTVDPHTAGALVRGWASQLEDEVRLWSIGAAWYVRDETFQKLFDEHRADPAAEEILWEMVTGPAPHDCVGEFTCTARVEVANKLARYWTEFPRGPRVAQAVTISAARLSEFLETCNAARGAETGSREENWWAQVHWEPDGAETAREIRATLTAVREEDKAPLVELFDGLEACAAAVGAVPGGAAEMSAPAADLGPDV